MKPRKTLTLTSSLLASGAVKCAHPSLPTRSEIPNVLLYPYPPIGDELTHFHFTTPPNRTYSLVSWDCKFAFHARSLAMMTLEKS